MSFLLITTQAWAFPKKISCLTTDGKFNIRVVNKKTKKGFEDLSVGYKVLFKMTYLIDNNFNYRGVFDAYEYKKTNEIHEFIGESSSIVTGQDDGPENMYMNIGSDNLRNGKGVIQFNYDQNGDGEKEEITLDVDCVLTESV
jgi:hypothetical protein